MSFKRPKVPKPKIPKVKKPTNSKQKKLSKAIKSITKKTPTKIIRKKEAVPKPKSSVSKKSSHKIKGVCYSGKNCKGKIVSNQCTRAKCKTLGGKSWKGISGCQEIS